MVKRHTSKRNLKEVAALMAKELKKLGDPKKRGILPEDPIQVYSDHIEDAGPPELISTGNHAIDRILGGGILVGRTAEIYGPYSSGKSVVLHEIMAAAQRDYDALVALGDSETTAVPGFMKRIGLRLDCMLHNEPDIVEHAFRQNWDIIDVLRNKLKEDRVCVLGFDSLAATSTKHEMEDFDKADMTKAKVIGSWLRRLTRLVSRERAAFVVVNQVRKKIGVMFGNPETTSGGEALGFHATQRIRVRQGSLYKEHKTGFTEAGIPVAGRIVVQVEKNKIGPPGRKCEAIINFSDGLIPWSGYADLLADEERIKRVGANFEYAGQRFRWFEIEDVLAKYPEILAEQGT